MRQLQSLSFLLWSVSRNSCANLPWNFTLLADMFFFWDDTKSERLWCSDIYMFCMIWMNLRYHGESPAYFIFILFLFLTDPSELVPEALEELPQCITSTCARMSMAVEREDLALVVELSAQLATGGMKLASAKRRCNPGSAVVVMKWTDSPDMDCEVSGLARRPIQAQNPPVMRKRFAQAASARGAQNPCRFQAHLPTW